MTMAITISQLFHFFDLRIDGDLPFRYQYSAFNHPAETCIVRYILFRMVIYLVFTSTMVKHALLCSSILSLCTVRNFVSLHTIPLKRL